MKLAMWDGGWSVGSVVECIVDVELIMIAFFMVVDCISGWGGQMFILTLVFENFLKKDLVQYDKKWECPPNHD